MYGFWRKPPAKTTHKQFMSVKLLMYAVSVEPSLVIMVDLADHSWGEILYYFANSGEIGEMLVKHLVTPELRAHIIFFIRFKLSNSSSKNKKQPSNIVHITRLKPNALLIITRKANLRKFTTHYRTYLGAMSDPCCIREPIVNQKLFRRVN